MHIVINKMEKINENKKIWKSLEVEIDLPEGINSEFKDNTLFIEGPKGKVFKFFRYPNVYIKIINNKVLIGTKKFSKREKKIIFTYKAHVNNLIKGVIEGFTYKLIVVYAKFPISINIKDNKFNVKNFLGEKVPRNCKITENVKVEIKDKIIIVTGIDKEKTGQLAATIEQLTRINHLDRRVVQDGIFITEKPHKRYS